MPAEQTAPCYQALGLLACPGSNSPLCCKQQPAPRHAPVLTLEELDALDEAEIVEGHLGAQKGDPEPGPNHSRAHHHGWRVRMMDLGELPIPPEHRELTRQWLARERARMGL